MLDPIPEAVVGSQEEFRADQNAQAGEDQRGMRLGDCHSPVVVEASQCDVLVTWNVKHFQGKTNIAV